MAVVGYCPLARGKVPADATLGKIGRAHGKTASQVALRFLEQHGIIPIPRTSKRERLAENLGSLDFTLSEAEILGVRDPDACTAYSAIDRAVIKMADELHETATVSPATWAALTQAFSNEEVIELVLAAGLWRMVAGFFNAAKVPLDEWVPSWPEGKAPA